MPFAIHDQIAYWTGARERFEALGIRVDRLVEGAEGRRARHTGHLRRRWRRGAAPLELAPGDRLLDLDSR